MIDPNRADVLMNYDLDEFKNSIWENFQGSQVQLSTIVEPDGSYKVINQNTEKLGPIQLSIQDGNLYQAWESSRYSEPEFQGDKPGQKKVVQSWICRPPNVLMFQLCRTGYDLKQQKLVKDNSKFDFD